MGELRIRHVNAADPVQFGLGAHVDQHGGRIVLQQRKGFLRRQRAKIRELVLLLALAGGLEEIVSGGHLRDKFEEWNWRRQSRNALFYSAGPIRSLIDCCWGVG